MYKMNVWLFIKHIGSREKRDQWNWVRKESEWAGGMETRLPFCMVRGNAEGTDFPRFVQNRICEPSKFSTKSPEID